MAQKTDYRGFEVLAVHPKLYCDDVVELASPNPNHNPHNNLSDALIIKRVGAGQVLSDFSRLEDALLKLTLARVERRGTSNIVPEITQTEIEMTEQYEALKRIVPYVQAMTIRNIQPAFSYN